MRHSLLLTWFMLLMPVAAQAQVTIDLRALDTLPAGPSASPKPPPRAVLRTVPASPTTPQATATPPSAPQGPPVASATPNIPASVSGGTPPAAAATTATTATAEPTAPTTPALPAATLPTGAPTVASLAPIPPPAAPANATPPAPPPVSATAGTTAAPESAGLRLTFKSNESDLSPDSNSAIAELVKASPAGDTITYNVVAYAAGATDDPSIARRLSLARGLSVRAALLADGVASTHIYVRALGASTGDGPEDRVDVTVLGVSGATAGATATTGTTQAGGATAGPPKP
jgi:outer membrane protein OmpA-like peptidoglycan-associated protein